MKRNYKYLLVGYMFFIFVTTLDASEIYYHWVDDFNVMLWKENEPNWITATLEKGEWKLEQGEKKAEWEKFILDKSSQIAYIKKNVPNFSTAKNEDILKAFLNYLREILPDDNMTALKYPDAFIYLQPLPAEPFNDRFKLIIINKTELFSWGVNLKWDQNTGAFLKSFLANLFKALDTKDELNKIFQIDMPNEKTQNEQNLWDTWMSQMSISKKTMTYIYETIKKQKMWLWVENISIKDIEKRLRPQPVKPKIKEMPGQTITGPIPSKSKLIFVFFGFFLGFITFFFGPRIIPRLRNKSAQINFIEKKSPNKNNLSWLKKRKEEKESNKSRKDKINANFEILKTILEKYYVKIDDFDIVKNGMIRLSGETEELLKLENRENKALIGIGKKVEEIYNKSEESQKSINIESWFNDFVLSAEQNKAKMKNLELIFKKEKTPEEDIEIATWFQNKIDQLNEYLEGMEKNKNYIDLGACLERAYNDSGKSQKEENADIWLAKILRAFQELEKKVKGVENQAGKWEYVEEYIHLGIILKDGHLQWNDPNKYKSCEKWFTTLLNKFVDLNKQINELTGEKKLMGELQEKIRMDMVKVASTREREELEDAWQAVKEKVKNDFDDIEKLKKMVLQHKTESTKKLKQFEGKLDEIKKYSDNIKKIIPYLWQGQMDIFDNLLEDKPEITSMISFLIYYSLFHFYEAAVENMISMREDDEEKNVSGNKMDFMLTNLIDISKKMQNPIPVLFGTMPFNGFRLSHDVIVKYLSPLPEALTFSKTGAAHPLNQSFFETLVSRLMNISNRKLNLSPFYYVDKLGEVYKAG